MEKEVIELSEAEVSEVKETQEVKPAKEIKVLGRVITIQKAEKPVQTEQPKPKKGRKVIPILIGTGAVAAVVVKAILAGKTARTVDPSEDDLLGLDAPEDHQDSHEAEYPTDLEETQTDVESVEE